MIIKDSENKVHRYSNKTNWKSKRRNEILRQIFPAVAVAAIAVILVALSFVQKKKPAKQARNLLQNRRQLKLQKRRKSWWKSPL